MYVYLIARLTGRKWAAKLEGIGIGTAQALVEADPALILQHWGRDGQSPERAPGKAQYRPGRG
jgi:hypothetical protein